MKQYTEQNPVPRERAATRPAEAARWLLLIHQLPPEPAYLRVKVGRRLQRVGAVAVKNSVYVLPARESCQEDFQWIAREIRAEAGEVSVCEAVFLEGLEGAAVEGLFHRARNDDYAEIAGQGRALLAALASSDAVEGTAQARRQMTRLKRRLEETAALDFFGAPGHTEAEAVLLAIESRLSPNLAAGTEAQGRSEGVDAHRERTWVTRTGVHVDRMASAWLIQRFVDPQARFKFVPARGYKPQPGELRFDMFEAEFTHEGDACTFEVLLERMGLSEPALNTIGEIIHDLDLKDAKFGRPETPGLQRLLDGIAFAHRDDKVRMERGKAVLDDLYAYYRRMGRAET